VDIDNSKASAFRTCPWKYYEEYVRKVEPIPTVGEGYTPLKFGSRMHELLEENYNPLRAPYLENENAILEAEAQLMIAAYKARYPQEDFEIVDVERTFKVALPKLCSDCYKEIFEEGQYFCPNCGGENAPQFHYLIGKIDVVYRQNGILNIMDHKTEKRGSKSNLPQKWGAKDQASLYLWAAERIYKEPIGNFIVNVLTRQSDKGLAGPSFPPDRQKLERGQKEINCAIRDIVLVADEITRYEKTFGNREWPATRENCYGWGYCDYYLLHRYGDDVETILEHKYKKKEEYLNLAGVPIIQ
jgi:PD-(D/E)XK nuclease superfamily